MDSLLERQVPVGRIGEVLLRVVSFQLVSQPSASVVATINACIVLVTSQTHEIVVASSFECKLHGVLIAKDVFHRIDGIFHCGGTCRETSLELCIGLCQFS